MGFLVDANLPRNFKWFNTPDFTLLQIGVMDFLTGKFGIMHLKTS